MSSFKHPLNNPAAAQVRDEQASLKFVPVLQAARRIQSLANRGIALYVIQCAVDNADDTCILEKARPLTEWNDMFVGSAVSMLSDIPSNKHVAAFFSKFGITA